MPKKLTSGETGFQIVPMGDVILGMFPAEEYFPFIKERWEIYQTALKILDLDLATIKFSQNGLHPAHVAELGADLPTTQIGAALQAGGELFTGFPDAISQRVHLVEPHPELREHFPGLFH